MSVSTPGLRSKPRAIAEFQRRGEVPFDSHVTRERQWRDTRRDSRCGVPNEEPREAHREARREAHREAHRVRVDIDESCVDSDALKVVRRLVRYGYEAYLVGGGVRDLLLGCRPKDFDIATAARPEQVRRLFRNARIIGRRFRLVHVHFGPEKVIEVATFRRSPDGPDADGPDEAVLIHTDNLFGQAHEDAIRRDLTINALLYDVQKREVLDFVGGMPDIQQRIIRTIGDPRTRFLEDPVRMVRAIKFCARLDLGMVPSLYDAIVLSRDALTAVSKPRLFEEMLKVMRCGASHRALWLMWETGLLHVVLPEVSMMLDDAPATSRLSERFWRMLTEVDNRTNRQGWPLQDISLMTVLLLTSMAEMLDGQADRLSAAFEYLEPIIMRMAIPKRVADGICRIVDVLPRLHSGKLGRFSKSELYSVALEVQSIDQAARR